MKADSKSPDANDLLSLITMHTFLKSLAKPHLEVLAASAMLKEFARDELIFREGDPANRFYLIESGSVALETSKKEKTPALIEMIGKGDVLGWSWLFPPYYWHFDARAAETTTAIFFYGIRLREQCEQDHDLGYELMKRMSSVMIHRLQATRRKLLETQGADK
ncbi:MAG: Crp/Fnr family transcriptional regulator [Verrucomicrobiota bacterium]